MNIFKYLVVSIGILFVTQGLASEKKPLSTIQFLEEAEWPPFTYESKGYASKGLSKDLMSSIFIPLGINVEITLYPQKRMLLQLQKGLADGATVISKNKERAKYLVYSDPLFLKLGRVYFARQKLSSFQWQTYKDLKHFKIGIVRGHNYGDEFANATRQLSLDITDLSNIEQLFEMLKLGRVDIILANEWTAMHFQNQEGYIGLFEAADKPYFAKGYHIGLSKYSPFVDRLPEINVRIKKLKEDGTIEKLISRYFSNSK